MLSEKYFYSEEQSEYIAGEGLQLFNYPEPLNDEITTEKPPVFPEEKFSKINLSGHSTFGVSYQT